MISENQLDSLIPNLEHIKNELHKRALKQINEENCIIKESGIQDIDFDEDEMKITIRYIVITEDDHISLVTSNIKIDSLNEGKIRYKNNGVK
jgi:poly(3-hydroxyalkanoate) synthetase